MLAYLDKNDAHYATGRGLNTVLSYSRTIVLARKILRLTY